MSIRFSPAVGSLYHLAALGLRRGNAAPPSWNVANDNATHAGAPEARFDPLLIDALRHFARHGLQAAQSAHRRAEGALIGGDHAAFAYWLGITRNFDRKLAHLAERSALMMGQ